MRYTVILFYTRLCVCIKYIPFEHTYLKINQNILYTTLKNDIISFVEDILIILRIRESF